jgi:hypothetical protein
MKRKITVLALAVLMLLTALPLTATAAAGKSSGVYTDTSGAWYSDAADKYATPEIFSADSGKFYPERKVTRIEFVRLLHKALGITVNYFAAPDISDSFTDMKNTDIGAGDLIDLVTAGIVEKGGAFNPQGQLDRDLMVHWLLTALTYKTGGSYSIPMVKPVPFKDDALISDSYRGEIYSAVVLKLVYGRGSNMFDPRAGATRAEAVAVVKRLADLLDSYKGGVDVSASSWLVKGGALVMSLTVRNNTDKEIVINHDSGQKYDFKLFNDKGSNVYTWSADKSFILTTGVTVLKPGESLEFSDTLDSAAYSAIKSAATMRAYIVGTSNDFAIDDAGYTAIIVK